MQPEGAGPGIGDSVNDRIAAEDAMAEDQKLQESLDALLARPRDEVVAECERTIVGQDAVVEEVVDLLYACLQRMRMRALGTDELDLPRACAFMLVGTTASGKSFIMKVVARVMGIALVSIDCAGITGAGWAGDSVSSELRRVAHALDAAPGQPVIAFWDEADKLVRSSSGQNRGFDAQSNFLKLLDGEEMVLEAEQPGQQEMTLNTARILNVFAGAFMGIEDIVKKRLLSHSLSVAGDRSNPGLMSAQELYRACSLQDLISWGFMPELVGRFGAVVSVPALSVASLRKIVKGSERSLEHRISNLLGPHRAFAIEDAAADRIAHEAARSGLGARRIDQLANRFAAKALAALQKPDGVNRATLVADEDGKLALSFDFDEGLPAEGPEEEAGPQDVPEALESTRLPQRSFAPDERIVSAVDTAMAGARFGDAAQSRLGRELLSARLADYQEWHRRDARALPAAKLLLQAVMGYLSLSQKGELGLGPVCAYVKLSDILLGNGITYLDILFFGRVELCGIRGLEERATADSALATPDTVAALSCYRRYLSYPEKVRHEAQALACARAFHATKSDQEAAWLRSDINEVALALDKETPFAGGMPVIF